MDYIDLDIRKCIHVSLMTNTHAGLKIQAAKLKLSMQAILDELANMVASEDPYVMKHLHELKRMKRRREASILSSTDADTLLDHIEQLEEDQ